MKAIQVNKFRIPAQRIAEMCWGEGGTHSYQTNRRGAYYYSCSGHGGYVVDSRCLTKTEQRRLAKYVKPINLQLFIQHRNGEGDVVIGLSCLNVPRSGRWLKSSTNFRYHPRLGTVEWKDLPIYLFEEDCDWAILEKLTNIRAEHEHLSDDQRAIYINNTFKSYAKGLYKSNLG